MSSSSFAVKKGNLILPIFLLIITTVYLATALQITPQFDEGLVGPSFVPVLASILMYVALGFVFRDILRAPAPTEDAAGDEVKEEDKPSLAAAIKIVLATAIYITVFKTLGYPLSTFLYVYALLFFFRLENTGQIRRIAYSAIITAVFYVLFAVIFQVRLPMLEGLLP
ncbi:tripartite tricarboxylate transporter TctB family protein [Thalassospira lucentensis]|uniref:tripartite tricarboxylate transporter TctB family protein n=1 Tax=Thalassospira lucentensis TaxID=168935 RepID=UPI002941FA72|nr:tripartite tricarboxylate transporter TctB family protein [Thalassospira lucentensis]WOI12354.1 tripartite tricarboxylate transporter TctB family protein [Thalassospira lucentensis]